MKTPIRRIDQTPTYETRRREKDRRARRIEMNRRHKAR